MKRIFLSTLALFLVSCSPQPIHQAIRLDTLTFPKLQFHVPMIERATLGNGMEIYLKVDHDLPLAEVTAMVGGGSIFDSSDKTGLSSLFAASLQTGGAGDRSPQQIELALANMAADLSITSNAYAYTLNMSMRSQNLLEGFKLLADVLRRPQFNPQRVEIARQGLIEGVRRQDDDPGSIARRALDQAIYRNHPLGRAAKQITLANITRSDLVRLQQTYFKPNNLSIAVSGDISIDELKILLNQTLGDWPQSELPDLEPPALPAMPKKGEISITDKDIPQTTIMIGQPGIDKNDPDLIALKVANYILGGGGFNSRMMREIRSNRGLVYSVYSYFKIGRELPELFIAKCETKCESTLKVVSLMRAQMQNLIDMPVTAKELRTAKQSLINSFVFAFNNSHAIVTRQQRLDFYDYPANYMKTYRQKIAAVTAADVQRVAKKHLHPDRLQIILVGRQIDFDQDPGAVIDLPKDNIELDRVR